MILLEQSDPQKDTTESNHEQPPKDDQTPTTTLSPAILPQSSLPSSPSISTERPQEPDQETETELPKDGPTTANEQRESYQLADPGTPIQRDEDRVNQRRLISPDKIDGSNSGRAESVTSSSSNSPSGTVLNRHAPGYVTRVERNRRGHDAVNGEDEKPLVQYIRTNIVGSREFVETPFGIRRLCFADCSSTGRPLEFIERYIYEEVLPVYANTLSISSGTARQTHKYREEAREIVRRSIEADEEEHAVIFCGSGSTGAIAKLVDVLQLRIPHDLDKNLPIAKRLPLTERPVVFLGPYESESNEMQWRESIAIVVAIEEDSDGNIDLARLEERLVQYANHKLKIGSFSAASNVTGVLTDTINIARILHGHGALAFFDYSAAGPYVAISMEPKDKDGIVFRGAHKDAVFLSPHMFPGGPGTAGVLCAKRELFANTVPVIPGSGSVLYSNSAWVSYVAKAEEREEAGTPAIIESIRCGLVFQLKDAVTSKLIVDLEERHFRRIVAGWEHNSRIVIMGPVDYVSRLAFLPIVIRGLHPNFVSTLLSDIFGIQTSSGNSSAGPYCHSLFNVDPAVYPRLEKAISESGYGILKGGWTCVGIPYFMDDASIDYIIAAVNFVAEWGWTFLPLYRPDLYSGTWTHRSLTAPKGNVNPTLFGLSYDSGKLTYRTRRPNCGDEKDMRNNWSTYLNDARNIVNQHISDLQTRPISEDPPPILFPSEYETLVYFLRPHDAVQALREGEHILRRFAAKPSVYNPAVNRYSTRSLANIQRSTIPPMVFMRYEHDPAQVTRLHDGEILAYKSSPGITHAMNTRNPMAWDRTTTELQVENPARFSKGSTELSNKSITSVNDIAIVSSFSKSNKAAAKNALKIEIPPPIEQSVSSLAIRCPIPDFTEPKLETRTPLNPPQPSTAKDTLRSIVRSMSKGAGVSAPATVAVSSATSASINSPTLPSTSNAEPNDVALQQQVIVDAIVANDLWLKIATDRLPRLKPKRGSLNPFTFKPKDHKLVDDRITRLQEIYAEAKATCFPHVKDMTVDELLKLSGSGTRLALVDVRERVEQMVSKIDGGLPVQEWLTRRNDLIVRDQSGLGPIVVVAVSTIGGRAGLWAAQTMRSDPSLVVRVLAGGIFAWIHALYPVVTGGSDSSHNVSVIHGFRRDLKELAPINFKVVLGVPINNVFGNEA